jgi:signal peptidase II
MFKKIFLLIVVDQVTKLILWPRDFFFGMLHVHGVKNFGLLFSIDFGIVVNAIIILFAFVFLIYFFRRERLAESEFGKITLSLILAGATSNIVDRLVLGYVRDFLDFGLGFTFNLADLLIVFGLLGLLITPRKPGLISEISLK